MYKKEPVTLTKNNNQYTLQINNLQTFKNYMKWLSDKILGENVGTNKREDTFVFKANSVTHIDDLLKKENKQLNYNQCKTIFLDLGEQLKALEMDGYGIFQFNKKDIFFINFDDTHTLCLFLNIQDCNPVVDNEYEVMFPFNLKYKYNSPEILNIKELPDKFLYYNSLIYSLSLFVCDCFSELKNEYNNFEKHLESILGTKLYWALLRCLELDPYDRYFLFI